MDSSLVDEELRAPPRQRSNSSSDFSLASTSSTVSSLANASSIPSQSSTSSSVDLRLFNCQFLDFPHKCLATTKLQSEVISLVQTGDFIVAGTQSHGMQLLQAQSLGSTSEAFSCAARTSSVKALLHLSGSEVLLSGHQNSRIKLWKSCKNRASPDDSKFTQTGSLPTMKDVLANIFIPGSYVRVRRHKTRLWLKHADAVSCFAYSNSSGLIFSGSWDKNVKVWRTSDMKCLQSFRAHDDAISAMVASGPFLYTAGADGKIKAWECSSKGKVSLLATLEGHKSSVNALAMDEQTGHLYSGSSDKNIVVWEREESASHMTRTDILKGHRMAVLCLCLTSRTENYTLLCSGSADKTVRVWRSDWKSGLHSCLTVIKGHNAPVKSLAILGFSSSTPYPLTSSSGLQVISGGLDCQIKSWCVSLDGSDEKCMSNNI